MRLGDIIVFSGISPISFLAPLMERIQVFRYVQLKFEKLRLTRGYAILPRCSKFFFHDITRDIVRPLKHAKMPLR